MRDIEIYSAYLPYEVKGMTKNRNRTITLKPNNMSYIDILILRPLSDLTKKEWLDKIVKFLVDEGIYKSEYAIDFNNYKSKIIKKPFGEVIKITNNDDWVLYLSIKEPDRLKHKIYQWLVKNHFDVFNQIEKGKAIDINTIK